MTKQTANYEECFNTLELKFGASINEINKAWRRLSKIYHPDKHNQNPHYYYKALERQKKINIARDILHRWSEQHPGMPPPRSAGSSRSSCGTKKGSVNPGTSSQNAAKQAQNKTATKQEPKHDQSKTQTKEACQHPESTAAFSPPKWQASLSQKALRSLDNLFSNKGLFGDPILPAIAAVLLTLFAPMYIFAGTINILFPELAGHYPEWLSATVFLGGIGSSIYIFAWYFAEIELIRLQEKNLQFLSTRKADELEATLKSVVSRYRLESGAWNFQCCPSGQIASSLFAENILPGLTQKRQIEFVYRSYACAGGAILDLAVRVKSPVHSFACTKIIRGIMKDLSSELSTIA